MGELYLTNVDFLKCGVPASIIAALVGTRILAFYRATDVLGIVYL